MAKNPNSLALLFYMAGLRSLQQKYDEAETIYRQILQKTRFGRGDVPTLRHCMSAGEHLSEEVLAGWRERFGLDVVSLPFKRA